MKQSNMVRLTKQNQFQLAAAVKGTLVSVNKAANHAIWLGLGSLRKKLGKKGTAQ